MRITITSSRNCTPKLTKICLKCIKYQNISFLQKLLIFTHFHLKKIWCDIDIAVYFHSAMKFSEHTRNCELSCPDHLSDQDIVMSSYVPIGLILQCVYYII